MRPSGCQWSRFKFVGARTGSPSTVVRAACGRAAVIMTVTGVTQARTRTGPPLDRDGRTPGGERPAKAPDPVTGRRPLAPGRATAASAKWAVRHSGWHIPSLIHWPLKFKVHSRVFQVCIFHDVSLVIPKNTTNLKCDLKPSVQLHLEPVESFYLSYIYHMHVI